MSRPALSATRALAVLNFLAAHPADSFTLSELAGRLEINGASAHALLNVMTDAGYLSRNARRRTYTLGPSVVAVGSAALEQHTTIDLARDAARELSESCGLEVAVTAVVGDEIVLLARAGARRARGIAIHVGQRLPFVPPLGSVFIAWADQREVSAWLHKAPHGFAAVLTGVRSRGYAVALEDEARRGLGAALDHLADAPIDGRLHAAVEQSLTELGRHEYQLTALDPQRRYDVAMIAAPVFDDSAHVALALTLIGFEPDLPAAEVARLGERVRDAGLVVTKRSRGKLPNAT